MTITLARNWNRLQVTNRAPPLSAIGSALAPPARVRYPSEQVAMASFTLLNGVGGRTLGVLAYCVAHSLLVAARKLATS